MSNVTADDQWLIEEDILGFLRGDSMPIPVLLRVILIPFEPGTSIQRVSAFCHSSSI